jgi:hypothetical protein
MNGQAYQTAFPALQHIPSFNVQMGGRPVRALTHRINRRRYMGSTTIHGQRHAECDCIHERRGMELRQAPVAARNYFVDCDWLIGRLRTMSETPAFEWNVQAIIAIIVVSAYAITQTFGLGVDEGGRAGEGLKDIALVVVGFYFGTQRH